MTSINSALPVQKKERIQVIDVLRGFAILGILLFNMRGFSGQAFPASSWSDPLDRYLVILLDFFVQAKFYSLFSFLFGWGMAVQMRRAESKGKKFFPLYLRRMLILLAFGAIHAVLLWTGDILFMYAILGIVILFIFRKLPPKFLLAAAFMFLLLAVILSIPGEAMDHTREWCVNFTECLAADRNLSESLYNTGSYWEVTQLRFQKFTVGLRWFPCFIGPVIAMMLLGLYTGKRKLFEDYEKHQKLFRRVMWTGLFIGVPLNAYFAYISAYPFTSEYFSLIRISSRTFGAPALTLFYITGITHLFQQEKWRIKLAPLAQAGRMALTNYISHSLFLPLVFYGYGLGLYGSVDPTFGVIFTLVIYRAQISISQWWFERFQFGPLEWLWRTLTYAMRHPFSAEATYDSLKKFSPKTRQQRRIILVIALIIILITGILLVDHLVGRQTEGAAITQIQHELSETSTAQALEPTPLGMSAAFAAEIELPPQVTPEPDSTSLDPGDLANGFQAELAFSHIEILSDDAYQGRYAGSKAGREAGDYIADQFAQANLRPVGTDGSYFQSFPLNNLVIDSDPSLSISGLNGTNSDNYQMHVDIVPVLGGYSGPGLADGEATWAVNCTQADFHEIDVVGRVVFCNSGEIQQQARLAVENGAVGLLLLTDPSSQPPEIKTALLETWIPDPIPVFQIYETAATDLLTGSGYSVADLSILYEPVDLNSSVQMEIEAHSACGQDTCTGRNLLGIIPGYDPEKNDQVIILSANYDGLGKAPDGTIWPGANDNASGIAILLEIARSWQEQGFGPNVTVLFAAWDAQEQEQQGLDYFLQNPIYPLDKTIALIHLDQVGSGSDILRINGDGFAGQIGGAAVSLGLETIHINDLSGAANLFLKAGLPFSILSWDRAEYSSRKPIDRADTIQLNLLERVGIITELVVLQLSEIPADIDSLLSDRCKAITDGDLPAFLNTSTFSQSDNDRFWFEDVLSLEPASCQMEITGIQMTGNAARADISVQLEIPTEEDEENTSISFRMSAVFRFIQNKWQWDGPELIRGESASTGSTLFTIYHPESDTDEVVGLAQLAVDEYIRIANLLALSPEMRGQIHIYSKANQLKVDTAPSHDGYMSKWISQNTLKFSYNPLNAPEDLRSSISHMLLANHEIPRDSFPWLWAGLPLILENNENQILQQSGKLVELQSQLAEDEILFNQATSWAGLKYIQNTMGYTGIGNLIEALGSACVVFDCESQEGQDQAFNDAMEMDQISFETALFDYWKSRLNSAQASLDLILTQRTEAVLSGDEAAFLETVDQGIPNLFIEERDWFKDLSQYPAETFQLTGTPIAILENGDILADVKMVYTLADVDPPIGRASLSLEILFRSENGEILWAGPIFHSVSGNHIRVRYQDDQEETAKFLLEDAEEIYQVIVNELKYTDPPDLTINLYENRFYYRASIFLSYPVPEWDPGWTAQGHSVKLLLNGDLESDDFQGTLALHLSRQLLLQLGVEDEWLLSGGSCYLSRNTTGGILQQRAGSWLLKVMYIINREAEFDFTDYPALYQLEEEEYKIALSQAWDSIRYFADLYGHDTLIDLFLSQRNTPGLDSSMQSTIHRTSQSFFTAWKESFLEGHIPNDALDTALQFDANEAMMYLDFLIDPELAGRQAGSPGSDLAAVYIAEKFAESGLIVEHQYFPVNYQTYLDTPLLELTVDGIETEFIYREDFLVLQPINVIGGLSADLVWIADDEYEGMDLDGKIAVRKATGSISLEISNAVEHGASALILVQDKNRDQELLAKYPFSSNLPEKAIPVIELTRSGFKIFLELLDLNQASLINTHPAILLDATANLQIALSDPIAAETSNVIGYLPGSNPDLVDELIIVGAHYDHIGYELGTPYSGANDNASGVAALLEIARLLQEESYRPGRSILFVAWGAQEPGELGSQYFLSNPAYPLENIAAVLQLDAIGGGNGFYMVASGDRDRDGLLLFSMMRASELAETRLLTTAPEVSTLPNQEWRYSPGSLYDSPRLPITSDDLPFREAGIPTMLLRWQKINERNLPDSLADEVLPERLESAGKTILATLLMLAR